MSGAAAAFIALTTGAYARVRSQFHVPIGKFEGVQERLARIAGNAYLLEAGAPPDLRGPGPGPPAVGDLGPAEVGAPPSACGW